MTGGWSSVRVVGGLIPPDVLAGVLGSDAPGSSSSDYHLAGVPPREAAAREWPHLLGAWRRFQDDLARLPDGDPAVGVTRERWLTVLFDALGYGRIPAAPAGGIEVGEWTYPVSHLWGATPMHLLGWGVGLDTRSPGVPGAAQRAPHALVQELLNRDQRYLWAVLSNGRSLRLLRDSTSLSGQAYVEFDLQTMFDSDLYAEFALLYLTVHQSRVEVPDGGQPTGCWLETWRTTAAQSGVRALAQLRDGVQDALLTLGNGFVRNPANTRLREQLAAGGWQPEDLHAALLQTVYRLLFWAVAEDRGVLLDPAADPAARYRYATYFSSARLRRLALRRHGTPHTDLWDAASRVFAALDAPEGEPRLALPGLGGLFEPPAVDVLAGARLDNVSLLAAVRSLSVTTPKGQKQRTVDFRHLGAEELGSVYESLLELVPRYDPTGPSFGLEELPGNDRKTSGSYYTPSSLVELVLDTALDPVLDDAEKSEDAASALLALKVCDPAIGSGHFMVAAARRIAKRLASARTGEVEPTPDTYTQAMHDVIGRCIYGVDVNPMAATLAKVSLWMEAMTPGRPLSFLDAHIKVGNALLGTTPALLADGIPDAAYAVLTGDDKATVRSWKKQNAVERAGQEALFGRDTAPVATRAAAAAAEEITAAAAAATTLAEVNTAAARYRAAAHAEAAVRARQAADAWCTAFLGPKTPADVAITTATVEAIGAGTASTNVIAAVAAMSGRHRLFHWHLEFPEVFTASETGPATTPTERTGGFNAMLGNPPWETVQMSEKEFFFSRDRDIADAATAAARKKMISALDPDGPLAVEFAQKSRRSAAETSLIRNGGRYPLCAVGKVNTYSIFAEHFRATISATGNIGIIVPTGIVTEATTQAFARAVAPELVALLDFRNNGFFEDVASAQGVRFSVLVVHGSLVREPATLSFRAMSIEEAISPKNQVSVTSADIEVLNPNTGTFPLFLGLIDAGITLACYTRHPILIREGDTEENPWGLRFTQGLFNMASGSEFFLDQEMLKDAATYDGWAYMDETNIWMPLYEAKMLNLWQSRHGTYENYQIVAGKGVRAIPTPTAEQLDNPKYEVRSRYWVDKTEVDRHTPDTWDRNWFLGWRDIATSLDVRTFVPSVLPKAAVGDKFLLAMPADPTGAPLLQATWSSLIFDYIARQKISGTGMKYFIVKQLACPAPAAFEQVPGWSGDSLDAFVRPRVAELTYTSYRIKPYAVDVVGGDPGEPFRWQPERREQLRAEIDAAMLHVYGLDRADAEHVLDSFFVLRKYEERDHGEFRTKRLVLTAYDAMAEAAETGVPFVSPLDPPPGHGPRHEARP